MKRHIGLLLLLASAAPQSLTQQSPPVVDRPIVFSKDIAPILYRHCVTCHRPDGVAPFSLITYDDARRHATQIAAATARRYMLNPDDALDLEKTARVALDVVTRITGEIALIAIAVAAAALAIAFWLRRRDLEVGSLKSEV